MECGGLGLETLTAFGVERGGQLTSLQQLTVTNELMTNDQLN